VGLRSPMAFRAVEVLGHNGEECGFSDSAPHTLPSDDDPERDRTLSRMGFAQAYSVAPCAKPVANDVYDVGCVISSIPVSIPHDRPDAESGICFDR